MDKKNITIYLSRENFEILYQAALNQKLSISDYIKSFLPLHSENATVTLNDALSLLESYPTNKIFIISDLFNKESYSNDSKRSMPRVGLDFYKEVSSGRIPNLEYLGPNSSNVATYIKR